MTYNVALTEAQRNLVSLLGDLSQKYFYARWEDNWGHISWVWLQDPTGNNGNRFTESEMSRLNWLKKAAGGWVTDPPSGCVSEDPNLFGMFVPWGKLLVFDRDMYAWEEIASELQEAFQEFKRECWSRVLLPPASATVERSWLRFEDAIEEITHRHISFGDNVREDTA